MAERAQSSAKHDGRFGETFDAELSVRGIVQMTLLLSAFCVLGMLITRGMILYYARLDEASRRTPVAAAEERRLPPGPVLQTDPEGELILMRREMAERLHGYGWVDEGAGTVHIPIDKAMDLLVERGIGGGGAAQSPVGGDLTEAVGE